MKEEILSFRPVPPQEVQDLNTIASVFGLNVFGEPAVTAEILNFNGNSEFGLGILGHAEFLADPTAVAIEQLSSFISNSHPPVKSFGAACNVKFRRTLLCKK